jgi:hypothetical protein
LHTLDKKSFIMLARARVAQFGAHDDARVVSYDHKMFIIQYTGHIFE